MSGAAILSIEATGGSGGKRPEEKMVYKVNLNQQCSYRLSKGAYLPNGSAKCLAQSCVTSYFWDRWREYRTMMPALYSAFSL